MALYVVDASVVVKWFLPEVHHAEARTVLRGGHALHAPDFLTVEVGNVLCKKVRRGEFDRAQADAILEVVYAVPVQLHPWRGYFDRAYQLAHRTGRSLYDCLYLALAVLLDGEMVTADRKFYDALQSSSLADHVCWVQDVP